MSIKIENIVPPSVEQWQMTIRGMRNAFNSWDKSDSFATTAEVPEIYIGDADLTLMRKLAKAGSDHRKFLRMLPVVMDVTAPLYWWKEADTYKVGTVANSCSTMHTIHVKEFTLDDFSFDASRNPEIHGELHLFGIKPYLAHTIDILNKAREGYLKTHDERYWRYMIELLPSSYNQKRTLFLNYEVLRSIYPARKNHRLDEWRDFCKTIVEEVPYFKEIFEIGGGA